MKVSDLKNCLEGMDENLEVGISYWDFSMKLNDVKVKNGICHLEFGDDITSEPANVVANESVGVEPEVSEEDYDAPDFTFGELTTIEDPNENSIRCWPVKGPEGNVVCYLRKKDSAQLRNEEQAQARNTAFRYWKLVNSSKTALIHAISGFLEHSIWTVNDEGVVYCPEENGLCPLVYFPE